MKLMNTLAFLLTGALFTLVASAPTSSPDDDGAQPHIPSFTRVFTAIDGTEVNVDIHGPASYSDLQDAVEGKKLRKRATGGLYLCDLPNFGQPCYYAVYPLAYSIRPDSYWVSRISSAGPDVGTKCVFSNSQTCGGTTHSMTYPGGNLPSGINNNLKCFSCGVGPTMVFPRQAPKETGSPEV